MTAPMAMESEQDRIARVRRDLATLKANGAPRDVIEYYLQKERVTPESDSGEHEGSDSTLGAFARSALATAANAAQAVPGMKAVQAGARSLVRGQSYRDALSDIEGETEKIPTPLRVAGQLPAAVATSALTPGLSAAKSGALYGAATQALDADPDMPLAERGARTVAGGLAGGALAKLLEGAGNVVGRGVTAVKALRSSEAPAEILAGQADELADVVGPAYDDFRQLGDLGKTPKLKAILKLPIVRRAVETVKGESPTLAGLPDTDARVLDAVYKRVGKKAFTAAHGFEPGEARSSLLDAIEEAAQAKGGSYADVVSTFKEGKGLQNATEQGVDAVRAALGARTGGKQLAKRSPEAFERIIKNATPAKRKAFEKVILSETGERLRDAGGVRVMDLVLGGGGFAAGGPVGLGAALAPAMIRGGRAVNAGHRMLSAVRGVNPNVTLPPGLTQSTLAALLESIRP